MRHNLQHNNVLNKKDIVSYKMDKLFNQLSFTEKVNYASTRKAVNRTLKKVIETKHLIEQLTKVKSHDSYAFDHAINVCMLSLLIGLHLNLEQEELHNLGIGALLHDIGMECINKELLYKPDALSNLEMKTIQEHPVVGYQMLRDNHEISEEAARIALQHHERLDGSGYPNGLIGNEIPLFSRIVAIADVFDALLSDRPFRKAFYPHEAVEIIVSSVEQFDPTIIKVLLDHIAIYPLGARVRLNNGEIGIVVDMNKGTHTRPIIRLEEGPEGEFPFFYEIDLSKHKELYIVKIIKE